ncbi:MAG: hypothetical protein WAN50_05085 [Minisyncoccia bacterium]
MEAETITNAPAVGGSTLEAFFFWYAFVAPRTILRIWKNYLDANLNYFSIPLLLRTLLYPWHRDTENYDGPFDLTGSARAIVVNVMSSVVGCIIRSVTIVIGLIAESVIFLLGPAAIVLWFATPFLLLAGFASYPASTFMMPQIPQVHLPDVHKYQLHP